MSEKDIDIVRMDEQVKVLNHTVFGKDGKPGLMGNLSQMANDFSEFKGSITAGVKYIITINVLIFMSIFGILLTAIIK